MAKRGRKRGGGDGVGIGVGEDPQIAGGVDAAGIKNAGRGDEAHNARTDDRLADFAADLGQFLGTVQNKATSWLDQRKAITEQLTQIRDTANQYLQQLGGKGDHVPFPFGRRGRPRGSGTAKRGPGRPKGSAAPPQAVGSGRKKRRTMSAEARQRIAEAQKKRWAKQKAAQGK